VTLPQLDRTGPDDGSERHSALIADLDQLGERVVAAREMSDTEQKFYDRKYAEYR